MADIFTKEKRSEIMRRIHSEGTNPEIRVRKFLFDRGLRYRLHSNELPGKPDLVFKKYKTAVFVHGCFWHGHACKIGSGVRRPKTNYEYWNKKIENNIRRDKENDIKLRELCWQVIKVWECQTVSEDSLETIFYPLLEMKNN